MALIAAELRRDALIAPSGCGQYRGEAGEYSARRAALCQMSSLGLMLVYLIYIRRQMCSRGSTAGILPDETRLPPHGGPQKQQSEGRCVSMFEDRLAGLNARLKDIVPSTETN